MAELRWSGGGRGGSFIITILRFRLFTFIIYVIMSAELWLNMNERGKQFNFNCGYNRVTLTILTSVCRLTFDLSENVEIQGSSNYLLSAFSNEKNKHKLYALRRKIMRPGMTWNDLKAIKIQIYWMVLNYTI